MNGKQDIPIDALKVLASDRDDSIRARVVRNPNTPIDILEKLASDRSINVRLTVAKMTRSTELLAKLAGDLDKKVRLAVLFLRSLVII
ncbi:MAG: hypothetical protein MUD14_29165 [Hydrococcus sp. Prado102]|jgi:hypothetical protein|nr:hypothetical protein [Hydrococcus sp. Prado102]